MRNLTEGSLQKRLFFTSKDVARELKIKLRSAQVLCTRYVNKGIIIRLKRNLYILRTKWTYLRNEEYLEIANFLQVPSYVSLLTALAFYEVTTQVPRDFFENICWKRTARYTINGRIFNYYKVKKEYYSGFKKENGVFIASPEKAFVDAVYLFSFGKYKIDFTALDFTKLQKKRLKQILKTYPQKTKRIARKICGI